MSILVYRESDGLIIKEVTCPLAMAGAQCEEGEAWMEVEGHIEHGEVYVDPETKVICPKLDYTLEALPIPCTLTIEGQDYHCEEQPEIEFDAPGTYRILVEAGTKYLRKEFTVENPA